MRVQTIYRIVVTRLALKETQKELPYPEFSYLNLPNLKVPNSNNNTKMNYYVDCQFKNGHFVFVAKNLSGKFCANLHKRIISTSAIRLILMLGMISISLCDEN